MFAANMKVFREQKMDCLERLYDGQVRCKLRDGTTIDNEFGLSDGEISLKKERRCLLLLSKSLFD